MLFKKNVIFRFILMLLIIWEWVKVRNEDCVVFIVVDFFVIVFFGIIEGVYCIDSWNDNKNYWNGLEF